MNVCTCSFLLLNDQTQTVTVVLHVTGQDDADKANIMPGYVMGSTGPGKTASRNSMCAGGVGGGGR